MSESGMDARFGQEFAATGRITDADFLTDPGTNIIAFPENPFAYAALLAKGTIGTIPKNREGTRVAIIGAGAAGLCAAYELMKVGVVPVIYEATGRIGGRSYSVPVTGDPAAVLELGAMRIPPSHETFKFYEQEFQMKTLDFPNPGVVDTLIAFENHSDVWKPKTDMPAYVAEVAQKFASFMIPKIGDLMNAAPAEQLRRWGFWVERYKNLGFLDALFLDSRWSSKDLAILGAIGAGTGGMSAQFRVSFLEIFRAALGATKTYTQLDKLIVGNDFGKGIECLTDTFWNKPTPTPTGTLSVQGIQDTKGHFHPAVDRIMRTKDREGVHVTDAGNRTEKFDAVILTCTTRALELGIQIDKQLFSERVLRAIRGIHYVNASKIVCSSEEKFWVTEDLPQVTLTDRPTRASYLIDYGSSAKAGACVLSYTWGDDSTKLLALSDKEQFDLCVRTLDDLHHGAISKQKLGRPQVIQWQMEAGYNGGFKLCYPGQYEDNVALFNQFKEGLNQGSKDGLFLAGEGVSWAGGWIEGALQSGINAALSVIRLLGGRPN